MAYNLYNLRCGFDNYINTICLILEYGFKNYIFKATN